jgi:hypothetical protein
VRYVLVLTHPKYTDASQPKYIDISEGKDNSEDVRPCIYNYSSSIILEQKFAEVILLTLTLTDVKILTLTLPLTDKVNLRLLLYETLNVKKKRCEIYLWINVDNEIVYKNYT